MNTQCVTSMIYVRTHVENVAYVRITCRYRLTLAHSMSAVLKNFGLILVAVGTHE